MSTLMDGGKKERNHLYLDSPGSLPKAPSDFGCSGVVSDTSKQSEESCHILGKYLKRAYMTMGAQRA